MRKTIIVPNPSWAANCVRFDSARGGTIGCRVATIEQAAARLVGGFIQPIDRISVLDAVREVLKNECPGEFEAARDLPGLPRAVTSSLMKTWSAGIDLQARKGENSRISALAEIETRVMAILPKNKFRPREIVAGAMAQIHLAPKILGSIEIMGRTEMSPVWRPLIFALAGHVSVTWDAGARSVPTWIGDGIKVKTLAPSGVPVEYVSCADGPQEVIAALRWARELVATGKALPHQIGICAAAPQAFDGAMSAYSAAGIMPVHFIHGRLSVEGREGQEAAALADIFLSDLSLQGLRRIAGLGGGPLWKTLPDDWQRILPREASLSSRGRWLRLLEDVTDWPGGASFKNELMAIVDLLDGNPETAAMVGQQLLGPQALAIWERALLEGPPEALLTSISVLAHPDETESLSSVVWGPAAYLSSYPRPFMWLMGLASGSWPRSIAEDPLLPDHIINPQELNPLPVADADRRDFETLLNCATGGVVVSRSRRDTEGRALGFSSLWPLNAKVREITKAEAPTAPISHGDRLAARPEEFKGTPEGAATLETWKNWHTAVLTPHDGLIRSGHPLVQAALKRPMSASTMQLMLTNPIGWLFQEVMSLEEPEVENEPLELDPRSFGNLVHGSIEGAIRSLGDKFVGASAEAIEAAVDAAAAVVAVEMEIDVPVPPSRLWKTTIERAKRMAVAALLPEFLEPLSGQKSWVEARFGYVGQERAEGLPWDSSVEVVLGGAQVRGLIDRVDIDGGGAKARVIDYKTGAKPKDIEDRFLAGGAEVQRVIYASVIKQLLKIKDVEAGLAYLRGDPHWAPLAEVDHYISTLDKRVKAMRAAIGGGLTVPGPAAGGEYSAFTIALPGDAKERYLEEKMPAIKKALGVASDVWDDR